MIKGKITHIFPYIFISAIFACIVCSLNNFQADIFGKNLLFSLGDMFGMQLLGFKLFCATGVAWFLSALFFVSFLIYPLLCKNRQLYTKYIAPLAALFVLGFLAKNEGGG